MLRRHHRRHLRLQHRYCHSDSVVAVADAAAVGAGGGCTVAVAVVSERIPERRQTGLWELLAVRNWLPDVAATCHFHSVDPFFL